MCKMIKKLILTFTNNPFLSSCAPLSLNDIVENSPADLEAKRLVYIGSKQDSVGQERAHGMRSCVTNMM